MAGTYKTTADYKALQTLDKRLVNALIEAQTAQGSDTDPLTAVAYTATYSKIPCPKGTYVDLESRVKVSDCLPCVATYACEEEGLTGLPDVATALPLCAKGFWCKSSAETRWPTETRISYYGPCPAGYYCVEGTEDPVACAEGTFSGQEGAWSADFCLPCPPGWKCTTTAGTGGLTAPGTVCSDGVRCVDGINELICGSGTSGYFCPIESHEEIRCPIGYYQTTSQRGYCNECPAGKYCMDGTA